MVPIGGATVCFWSSSKRITLLGRFFVDWVPNWRVNISYSIGVLNKLRVTYYKFIILYVKPHRKLGPQCALRLKLLFEPAISTHCSDVSIFKMADRQGSDSSQKHTPLHGISLANLGGNLNFGPTLVPASDSSPILLRNQTTATPTTSRGNVFRYKGFKL